MWRPVICLLLSPLMPVLIFAQLFCKPFAQPFVQTFSQLFARTEIRRAEAGNHAIIVAMVEASPVADLAEPDDHTNHVDHADMNLSAADRVSEYAREYTREYAHEDAHESAREAALRKAREDADYLPPSQLTERPQRLSDPGPIWTRAPLQHRVDGVLLINEYGDVDQVIIVSSSVTPAQRQALRELLLLARFTPGRLYGRAVKTALKIEVTLD